MNLLSKINFIVVHATDTKTSMNISTDDLRQWHVIENGWSDIGYHYLIKFDGSIHTCRDEKYQGAHCKTVNDKSLAIALEGGYGGEDNFTEIQKSALLHFICDLKIKHTSKTNQIFNRGHILAP